MERSRSLSSDRLFQSACLMKTTKVVIAREVVVNQCARVKQGMYCKQE